MDEVPGGCVKVVVMDGEEVDVGDRERLEGCEAEVGDG